MDIQEVRQKFPQYDDLSDQQLADALHAKYYPDMDKGEYYQKIGFSIQKTTPKKEPVSERIGGYFKEMIGNIPGNVADIAKGVGGVIVDPIGTLQGVSDVVSGAGSALLREVGGNLVPGSEAEDTFNAFRRGISEPILESIEEPAGVPGRIADFAKERPVDFALTVIPAAASGKHALKVTPAKIDRKISATATKGVEKGIRPSVEGNRTAAQTARYAQNAREAVETIILNKNSLRLTNDAGEIVSGLPKNLKQFSQAIDQAKRSVYEQYNAMAVQAGKAGVEIDLKPVSRELSQIANDAKMKKFAPDIAAYAQGRARDILTDTDKIGILDAQDAITMMNKSLESFYKNPSYDTASRAYIDSVIVNNMRRSLDNAIENATGAGYSDLKKAYGSLKSIERDVNRRSVVDARKNTKGLIDFTDVFTHTTAVHGILSLNPAIVGASVAGKGTKMLYKLKTDPNRIVKNMFTETERLMERRKALSK